MKKKRTSTNERERDKVTRDLPYREKTKPERGPYLRENQQAGPTMNLFYGNGGGRGVVEKLRG